ASAALLRAGTEDQKRRWLEPIAAGEIRATVALGNEFVMDAEVADLILRFTRDGGVEEIDKSALTITRTPSMDETRKLYTLLPASGEKVPKADEGQAIDVATVMLCAEMVGGMQWILDATVEYAKTRQQFGRVIGSFQAVQH